MDDAWTDKCMYAWMEALMGVWIDQGWVDA